MVAAKGSLVNRTVSSGAPAMRPPPGMGDLHATPSRSNRYVVGQHERLGTGQHHDVPDCCILVDTVFRVRNDGVPAGMVASRLPRK